MVAESFPLQQRTRWLARHTVDDDVVVLEPDDLDLGLGAARVGVFADTRPGATVAVNPKNQRSVCGGGRQIPGKLVTQS